MFTQSEGESMQRAGWDFFDRMPILTRQTGTGRSLAPLSSKPHAGQEHAVSLMARELQDGGVP